jgi:hypothetical protein
MHGQQNIKKCIEECFEENLCVLIIGCCGPVTPLLNRARFLLGSYKTELNSAISF